MQQSPFTTSPARKSPLSATRSNGARTLLTSVRSRHLSRLEGLSLALRVRVQPARTGSTARVRSRSRAYALETGGNAQAPRECRFADVVEAREEAVGPLALAILEKGHAGRVARAANDGDDHALLLLGLILDDVVLGVRLGCERRELLHHGVRQSSAWVQRWGRRLTCFSESGWLEACIFGLGCK